MASSAPPHPVAGSDRPRERGLVIVPRAPFRLDLTAWGLRRRAHNTIDRWDGHVYRRALALDGDPVAVSVTQSGSRDSPRLAVTLSGRPIDDRAEAAARAALNKLLGLRIDLSGFAALAAGDPLLGELAERLRGLKPPRFPTVFEALVNGIANQQLSITVGIHLLGRLTAARGRPVPDDPDDLHAFPGPTDLASATTDELKGMGFSFAKARTILEAATAIADGDLDLEALEQLDDETAIECLTSLYGVGRWTAEYVMLRGLGRLHIFPGDDVGARNKLKRFFEIEAPLDYDAIARLLARWYPYAGVIYFHMLLDSLTQAGLVAEVTPPQV
ncbi:MAG: DNA-3-methyladenine glycosylase 2 family protein [Actinomycetota bacterium]|nr:DNA-3-methyladenine glycosylase 2 family protein [Actinomycetota bacterium]